MKQSVKLFGKEILVETIAVFIGITLALIIDGYQEDRQILSATHSHLDLMETQLIRDTFYVSDLEIDMEGLMDGIDSVINQGEIQLLVRAEKMFIYEPPTELLNALLTSSSYNSIYDSIIFNSVSSQLRDFRLYMNVQTKIDEVQKSFIYSYIYPNKDFATGKLNTGNLKEDNKMMNELLLLRGLYEVRYSTLLSIQINYRRLLTQIAKRIHLK